MIASDMVAFAAIAAAIWTTGRWLAWRWLEEDRQRNSFKGSEEYVTALCMCVIGLFAGAQFVT